jgi:hypothetical protein
MPRDQSAELAKVVLQWTIIHKIHARRFLTATQASTLNIFRGNYQVYGTVRNGYVYYIFHIRQHHL